MAAAASRPPCPSAGPYLTPPAAVSGVLISAPWAPFRRSYGPAEKAGQAIDGPRVFRDKDFGGEGSAGALRA